MADKKISQLTGATTPLGGTEEIPLVQGSTTKKVSVADLTAGRAVSAGQLDVDNIRIDVNTISSTNTNGNIVLDPNGSGNVNVALSAGGQANVNATIFQDTALNLASASGSSGTQSRITLGDGTYLTGSLSAFGSGYGSGLNYGVMLGSNIVTNTSLAGGVQYSGPAPATRLFQADGRHYLQYAATGTAGATVTWSTACSTTTTGNLAFPAGKGIDFSANTAAPGATSELLNWYEEGTWTPTLNATSFSGATYSIQNGVYTRIGNMVTVQCDVQLSALTSGGTNYLRVEGIPFVTNATAKGGTGAVYAENLTGGTLGNYIVGFIGSGQTSINLWEQSNTGITAATGMSGARLTATSRFIFTATYRVF